MISGYSGEFKAIRNLMNVVIKNIKMYGFVVSTLWAKYEESFDKEIPAFIAKGEFKYKEDRTLGLEQSGQALLDVMTGKNIGKKVIVVAEEWWDQLSSGPITSIMRTLCRRTDLSSDIGCIPHATSCFDHVYKWIQA